LIFKQDGVFISSFFIIKSVFSVFAGEEKKEEKMDVTTPADEKKGTTPLLKYIYIQKLYLLYIYLYI